MPSTGILEDSLVFLDYIIQLLEEKDTHECAENFQASDNEVDQTTVLANEIEGTKIDKDEDKSANVVKYSTLNPNAKEFVFNPNAKSFTPRSVSVATTAPAQPQPQQIQDQSPIMAVPHTQIIPSLPQPIFTAMPPQYVMQAAPVSMALTSPFAAAPLVPQPPRFRKATGQPLLGPSGIHTPSQLTLQYTSPPGVLHTSTPNQPTVGYPQIIFMSRTGKINQIGGEVEIEWKITNFLSPSKIDEKFESPTFNILGASWYLRCYPNGESRNNSLGWIGLFISREDSGSPVSMKFTFGLKTTEDKKKILHYTLSHVFQKCEEWGFAEAIRRSDVLEKKSELIPSGVLTITCNLKCSPSNTIASASVTTVMITLVTTTVTSTTTTCTEGKNTSLTTSKRKLDKLYATSTTNGSCGITTTVTSVVTTPASVAVTTPSIVPVVSPVSFKSGNAQNVCRKLPQKAHRTIVLNSSDSNQTVNPDVANTCTVLPKNSTSTETGQSGSSDSSVNKIKFCPSTGIDFTMIDGKSKAIKVRYQCINETQECKIKSFEELRYEDYIAGNIIRGAKPAGKPFDFSPIASTGFNFNYATQSKPLLETITTTKFSTDKIKDLQQVGELLDSSSMRKEITWKISNFFSLVLLNHSSVVSPVFTFANATWCLQLLPCSQDAFKNTHIGLKIKRLHSCLPEHRISYTLSIQSIPAGKCKIESKSEYVFNELFPEGGVPFLVERSRLFAEKNAFAPNGTATLFCQMNIKKLDERIRIDAPSRTESLHSDNSLRILCENFRNLLVNGQDHDLTLRVKDKAFRAHQNILRARSQVLDSMLSHDMIEKNRGLVTIPDCDPKAFEQFLLYLYTGKSDSLDQSNILQLYYVADKYDMADLKEECRQFIQKSLSSLVICDVIKLALNHCDSQLLKCATEYFIGNADKILTTVEWQLFMKKNPTQANELLIKTVTKLSSEKLKI